MAEKSQEEAVFAHGEENFADLLEKEFKPRTDAAKEEINLAVQTLASRALEGANVVPGQVVKTIRGIIREIDEKLTQQVNEILHHDDFQQLEGAWRGLHFLCKRSETGPDLKIRVMNISKKELGAELSKTSGDDAEVSWDSGSLFSKVYEKGYGVLVG